MADQTPKPKTVTVESIEWHTYNGKEYPIGATYEIDEQLVDSVEQQGKAIRVDRVAHAAPAKPVKPAKPSKTAVAPMTLSDKAVRASGAPTPLVGTPGTAKARARAVAPRPRASAKRAAKKSSR